MNGSREDYLHAISSLGDKCLLPVETERAGALFEKTHARLDAEEDSICGSIRHITSYVETLEAENTGLKAALEQCISGHEEPIGSELDESDENEMPGNFPGEERTYRALYALVLSGTPWATTDRGLRAYEHVNKALGSKTHHEMKTHAAEALRELDECSEQFCSRIISEVAELRSALAEDALPREIAPEWRDENEEPVSHETDSAIEEECAPCAAAAAAAAAAKKT